MLVNGIHLEDIGSGLILCIEGNNIVFILDGCMYDEPVLLPDGKEVLFSLYRKKECIASDKREYELLLGAYSDMSEVLGSMVIQGRPFKEVIMDDDTELLGQD